MQNVSATRMELLRLRRRLELASRGHKLLSQKRDEISRHLIRIAREIGPLRRQVEEQLLQTFRRFMLARATMEPEQVKVAMAVPTKRLNLAVSIGSIMNVRVPHLTKEISGQIIGYGYAQTSGELDVALLALEKAFDKLIELAEKEKQARLLAIELNLTRRRVNVLEYVMIPELHQTIRFINNKLAEAERDNTSRLMKIAKMIRQ
ncbi:MAG: V-type ATP synthase subunit D [Sedimentisphaerales bacterium]|jgi:V/A-type H+-transporting ATPase subunit D|nr:V-type ATP synthase subunit D [Sedimentisphaerales bacterium]